MMMNNAVLTFNVPEADINNLTFDGGTQEASFELLKDWLKNNKDGLMKKILKAGVENTPYDMVAGNPNSLMATMTDTSFQRAGGGVVIPTCRRRCVGKFCILYIS